MTFSMLTKDKSMILEEFQSLLLGHEQLLEHQGVTTEKPSCNWKRQSPSVENSSQKGHTIPLLLMVPKK
jgi:hypothetical protein